EPALGDLGDDVGEGGLAGAGRAPQDEAHGGVVVDELAERRSRRGEVPLPDHLIEGARAHADGERRRLLLRSLAGLVEQTVHRARLLAVPALLTGLGAWLRVDARFLALGRRDRGRRAG